MPVGDETAFRRWQAEQFLAMLSADVGDLEHLERLQHHLQAFSDAVWRWRSQ